MHAIAFDPELEMLWLSDQYSLSSYTLQQTESLTWSIYSCFHSGCSHPPHEIGFLGSGDHTMVTVADRDSVRCFKRGGITVMYLALPADTQPIEHMKVSQADNTIYYTGSRGLTQAKIGEDWSTDCQSVSSEFPLETLSISSSHVVTGTSSGSVLVRDMKSLKSVVAELTPTRSAIKATEVFDRTVIVAYSERSSAITKIYDLRNPSEPLHTVSDLQCGAGGSVLSIKHFQDNIGTRSHHAFLLTPHMLYTMQLEGENGPTCVETPLSEEKGSCIAVSPSNTCAAVGYERGTFSAYSHPYTAKADFVMSNFQQPQRPHPPVYSQSWTEANIASGFDESVPEPLLASSWPEPNYMILTVPQKLHCIDIGRNTPAANQWGLHRADSFLPDRKDNLSARFPNPFPFNAMLGDDPARVLERLIELRREYKRRMKPSNRVTNGLDDYAPMESAQVFYVSHPKATWKTLNEIPTKVVGLDNSLPESWITPLLQCLYLCQPPEYPIRQVILHHLCSRQYCLACEISFIFSNMLLLASGQHTNKDYTSPPVVQIAHLLRTMALLPAFEGVFVKPKSRDDAVAKLHQCQRELLKALHHSLQDQSAYPFMDHVPPSEEYKDSIAAFFGTEFEGGNATKIDPRFYWEVPGSALKVDEGLQHLLKEVEGRQGKSQIKRLPPVIVLLLNPEHSHLKPPYSLKISKYNGEDYNYVLNSNVIHLADDVDDIGNFVSHQRIKDDAFVLVNDYRVTHPMPPRDLEQLVPALRSYTAVVSYYALSQNPNASRQEDGRLANLWHTLGPLLTNDIFAPPLQRDRSQAFKSPLKSYQDIRSGTLVAIDAEYVVLKWAVRDDVEISFPVSSRKPHMALARVSCILSREPGDEQTILDDYVNTPEEIEDYVTQFSGIRAGDLDALKSTKSLTALKATYLKLRALVDAGVIFVGHGLAQDFRVCNIVVPKRQIIDTLLLFHKTSSRYMSLRFLAFHLLGEKVQEEEHDSIEDARTSLRLYRKYEQLKKEGSLDSTLDHLLAKGAETNWFVPSTRATGLSPMDPSLASPTMLSPT